MERTTPGLRICPRTASVELTEDYPSEVSMFRKLVKRIPLPLCNGAPYTITSGVILARVLAGVHYAFRTSIGTSLRIGRGIADGLG